MEDVFRLRYEVYCNERRYLPQADYPLGMEADEYDVSASHFVVYGSHLRPVGYLRTVPADGEGRFPVFLHGLGAFRGLRLPHPATAVECSRLLVRPDIRFQPVHVSFPSDPLLPNPPAANASVLIQTKLVRMAYRNALDHDIRYFYAALEPALGRRLNMLGFPMRVIGPPGDYFGTVYPHLMDLREMERKLRATAPLVWAFFDNPADDPHSITYSPGEWQMPSALGINGETNHGGVRLSGPRNPKQGLRLG